MNILFPILLNVLVYWTVGYDSDFDRTLIFSKIFQIIKVFKIKYFTNAIKKILTDIILLRKNNFFIY